MTLTSAPGSDAGPRLRPSRRAGGFTLIELLVVIAIIAFASVAMTYAVRDPSATALEREAARLSALFESARAQSRSLGMPVRWLPAAAEREPGTADFRFAGLPGSAEMPTHWLATGVQADLTDPRGVVLGPEPMVGAQRVVLRLNERRIVIATDGLSPFAVADDEPAPAGR
jgi:general secretion pathway protein H